MNFWPSFAEAEVRPDFERIRDDGFNAVILLLPMRIFNTGNRPATEFATRRLMLLLDEARRCGLMVILRLNYPHDISPTNLDIAPRVSSQLTSLIHLRDDVYESYLSHLDYVKEITAGRDEVVSVFLSWEDNWGVFKYFPRLDAEARRDYSQRIGFDRFVKTGLSRELCLAFGFSEHRINPIPEPDDPQFVIFKLFYDAYILEKFIAPARKIFPNLAYEQRVDGQVITDVHGKKHWVNFASYPDQDIVNFSYWAPFMGQKNDGEEIDDVTALKGLRRIEDAVRRRGKRKHFIDQFNFVNGTAEFTQTSARIAKDRLPAFLSGALPYLREETLGYGIWAYRDYRETYVVNSNFDNGLFGWNIAGNARVTGDRMHWLQLGGKPELRTEIFCARPLAAFKTYYGAFHLSFETDGPVSDALVAQGLSCTAEFCGATASVSFAPGASVHACRLDVDYESYKEMGYPLTIRFSIPAGSQLAIRNVQFYNHILTNGMYTVDGEDRPAVAAMRNFQRALADFSESAPARGRLTATG